MKISVCCPSYHRPRVETLDYLPFVRVYVDNKEFDEYVKNNPQETDIIAVPDGVQGNLCRIRNYILDSEFNSGIDVVCLIDDDMKGLYCWEKKERRKLPADEWQGFLQKYSLICKEWGAFFWGVNVNQDYQSYRENNPFSTVSYIGGPFQVHLKESGLRYDERFPLKEDYDMTLQHLNTYRKALRVNKFFYIVKQSEQKGGCATMRNLEVEKGQLEALQKKWGTKIVKNDPRKNRSNNMVKTKGKNYIDYNPVIHVPIKGV